MDDVQKQALLGAFRTLLAVAGAWLAAHKYIDAGAVDQIIGAVMIAIPIAWSVLDKYRAEREAKRREGVALNAGITISNSQPLIFTPGVPLAEVPAAIKSVTPA